MKEESKTSWTQLRNAQVISLNGHVRGYFHMDVEYFEADAELAFRGITAADVTTLTDVVKGGLPRLQEINLCGDDNAAMGDEGLQTLMEVLGSRALTSLRYLSLAGASIGDAGARFLAAALSRGAMPSLAWLRLSDGIKIGDAGMVALAAPLRKHPRLRLLGLSAAKQISHEGVAALVAPGEGVLQTLEQLHLDELDIGDEGCASLVAALDSGMLPKLEQIGAMVPGYCQLPSADAVAGFAASTCERRSALLLKTSEEVQGGSLLPQGMDCKAVRDDDLFCRIPYLRGPC